MNKSKPSIFSIDLNSILSILPKSPYLRLLMALIITFGFGTGLGISNGIIEVQQPSAITQSLNFSRAEYERLRLKMPLVEVEAILGRGTEIEQSATTTTFVWQNPDKSTIKGIFEDGKLIYKKQEGF